MSQPGGRSWSVDFRFQGGTALCQETVLPRHTWRNSSSLGTQDGGPCGVSEHSRMGSNDGLSSPAGQHASAPSGLQSWKDTHSVAWGLIVRALWGKNNSFGVEPAAVFPADVSLVCVAVWLCVCPIDS